VVHATMNGILYFFVVDDQRDVADGENLISISIKPQP
jgi:hypothetical protein